MNSEFFMSNRKKFIEKMKEDSTAVFFSKKAPRENADAFYAHSVGRDFFYLTGIDREDMVLVISKIQGDVTETLYIPPVDETFEKWFGILVKKDEATKISGIQTVLDRNEFEQSFGKKTTYSERPDNIYIFLYYSDLYEPRSIEQIFASQIRKQFPSINIINSLEIITELRSVKQPEEIVEIRKAIDITKDALEYMMSNLHTGTFEYEARAHYEYIISLKGSKVGFPSIVATGKNATILHYWDPKVKSKENDLMLFDVGALSNYYSSDISRTYPVNGKFTGRQKDFYNIVLEAQVVAADFMKPGVRDVDVNNKVIKFYEKELKNMKLIKDKNEVSKYYYHGVGHPLGLDVHDIRRKDKCLVENGVYTIEPGLYIAEEGIGIRIEDDVLVTKTGVEILSAGIMKEVEDIENFMR